MANKTAEKAAQVAVLNEQIFGTPAVNPYDAQLARIDLELVRVNALMLNGDHVPGSFLGDVAEASTMCSECKCGGFHPDELQDGVCSGCGKKPAMCAACGFETKRQELNEDLLCTGCESGARAEAA